MMNQFKNVLEMQIYALERASLCFHKATQPKCLVVKCKKYTGNEACDKPQSCFQIFIV